MSTTPLIVAEEGGLFSVGATDFSDAVSKVELHVDANEVVLPQTFATPVTSRVGARKYSLVIDYYSNDKSLTAELFGVLWNAITTSDGQLAFVLQMRAGSVSATNPSWTGTFVALSTQMGGQSGDLSVASSTFPLTGIPVRATS